MKKLSSKRDSEEAILKAFVRVFIECECPELLRERKRIARARQRAAKKKRDGKKLKVIDPTLREACARELQKLLAAGPKPVLEIRHAIMQAGYTRKQLGRAVIDLRIKKRQISRPGPLCLVLPEKARTSAYIEPERGDRFDCTH